MARLFDDAATQYLTRTQPVVSFAPFTVHAWARTDDASVDGCVFGIATSSLTSNFWILRFLGTDAAKPIRWDIHSGASAITTATSSGFTANQWHAVCAVEASATDHRVFIDGGSKGTNSNNRAPSAPNVTSIGRLSRSTPGQYFSGDIAEVAVWDVALSDAEVALLASGFSPLLMRSSSLVAYWPLIGRTSPETDLVGGYSMNLVNGPTTSVHPRVFYARRRG